MSATELLEKPAETERPGGGRPPKRDARRFRKGYVIYVLVMLAVIVAGLTFLWDRMDVYERSRPARAMEAWLAKNTEAEWLRLLLEQGFDPAYVEGLDLSAPEYYKRLGDYTDERPVYNVSFAARPMLSASLRPGKALGFGSHLWELDGVEAVDSGFTVYAPEDAAVMLRGAPLGPEYPTQRDAQKLTLSVFESGRDDIRGLTKYVLNRSFNADGVTVVAADGTELKPSYSSANAVYFAPMTMRCRISVPMGAEVTVNGVPVTGANASAETREAHSDEYELFKGVEASLPFTWEKSFRTVWTVEDLVAEPEVAAALPDGTALKAEIADGVWDFPTPRAGVPDPELKAELHDYIMEVFDAHMAYLGNRDDNLAANYSRFTKYLVPGSEAQTQAVGAQISLVWNHDMDTRPNAELQEVLRYHPDCFTARVEFADGSLRSGQIYHNIYIFVRSGGAWRVVRIVNE